jgi:hypothetical protein
MPLTSTNRRLTALVNPAGSLGAVETEPMPSCTRTGAAEAADDAHPSSSKTSVASAAVQRKPRRAGGDDASVPSWPDGSAGELLMDKLL